MALCNRAKLSLPDEALNLYGEAEDKYLRAVEIKPDMQEAFYNWANLLIKRSYQETDDQRQRTLLQVIGLCSYAEEITPGSVSYNLACAHSRLGNEEDCLKWLESALTHGTLPNKEHFFDDKDFEPVREKEWFKEFIRRAYPE